MFQLTLEVDSYVLFRKILSILEPTIRRQTGSVTQTVSKVAWEALPVGKYFPLQANCAWDIKGTSMDQKFKGEYSR